jgi:16S rRNA G527 N7-methylase RsmG
LIESAKKKYAFYTAMATESGNTTNCVKSDADDLWRAS